MMDQEFIRYIDSCVMAWETELLELNKSNELNNNRLIKLQAYIDAYKTIKLIYMKKHKEN